MSIPRGATPLPHLSLPPLSFPVVELGDQKELPAGQEEGLVSLCANPGPEVFTETWETSRRGSQSYTAAELISQHSPPHEEEGERPSELGGREKAVTVLSSFWYKRLPEPTILLQ